MKAKLIGLGLAAALLVPTAAEALDVRTARTMCRIPETALACDAYLRGSLEGIQLAQIMDAEYLGYDEYEVAQVCPVGDMKDVMDSVKRALHGASFDPNMPAYYAVYAAAKALYPCGVEI